MPTDVVLSSAYVVLSSACQLILFQGHYNTTLPVVSGSGSIDGFVNVGLAESKVQEWEQPLKMSLFAPLVVDSKHRRCTW